MEEAVGLLALVFGLAVATAAVHHVRDSTVGGALERNVLLGLRTRATLSSDRAWREGHLAAVPRLTAAVRAGYTAAALAAVSLLAALAADALLPLAWIAAVAGYAALMGFLVAATARADAVARAAGERGDR
ncbi:hypothetical protein CQJ94_28100 [Glycomyces fuscus]|nr:hypothetical protein CQJ94_28100 [Glycomyces fuscus]